MRASSPLDLRHDFAADILASGMGHNVASSEFVTRGNDGPNPDNLTSHHGSEADFTIGICENLLNAGMRDWQRRPCLDDFRRIIGRSDAAHCRMMDL